MRDNYYTYERNRWKWRFENEKNEKLHKSRFPIIWEWRHRTVDTRNIPRTCLLTWIFFSHRSHDTDDSVSCVTCNLAALDSLSLCECCSVASCTPVWAVWESFSVDKLPLDGYYIDVSDDSQSGLLWPSPLHCHICRIVRLSLAQSKSLNFSTCWHKHCFMMNEFYCTS